MCRARRKCTDSLGSRETRYARETNVSRTRVPSAIDRKRRLKRARLAGNLHSTQMRARESDARESSALAMSSGRCSCLQAIGARRLRLWTAHCVMVMVEGEECRGIFLVFAKEGLAFRERVVEGSARDGLSSDARVAAARCGLAHLATKDGRRRASSHSERRQLVVVAITRA